KCLRKQMMFTLSHEYSEASLSIDNLKGRDRAFTEILLRASKKFNCHFALCLLTYKRHYDYQGYYSSSSDDFIAESEMEFMEHSIQLSNFVDENGNKMVLEGDVFDEDVISERPL